MHFYSAEAGGFYHAEIHSQMPDDVIAITASEHSMLLQALADGKCITLVDGVATAVEPSPRSEEELLERLRLKRDRLLNACDYLMMPDYPIEAALRGDWAAYRQALRDMPENNADLTNIIWPEPPTTGQR